MGLRDTLKYFYRKTAIGGVLLQPYIYFRDYLLPEKTLAKRKFKRLLGYSLNLDAPKTFNEKLQWLKLHERTPLHTQCADKYRVRAHVEKKIGAEYLIPLVYQTENVEEIIPENFPEHPFIIKTNHDSGGGIFVHDKSEIDWGQVRDTLGKRLKHNYYHGHGEWQYKNIEPCILAENLLSDEQGNIPADYKLHCFNGKLGFIQIDLDRETDHRRNIYDPEWNLLECTYLYKKGATLEKPKVLDKMRELAEILASDFTFARVDFYNIGEKIYFGEITFHPESGTGKFTPQSWDQKFGELMTLPQQN